MKAYIKILFLIAFACTSCSDVLEEDITNDLVTLTNPQDDHEITSNIVHFEWRALDGVDTYRIQVFSEDHYKVVDAAVDSTAYQTALPPGHYQWRVRGENFAYTSAYSDSNSFSVIQTDDLSAKEVVLNGPSDNYYTKNMSVTLSWQPLYAADKYELQILNTQTGQVTDKTDLTATSFTLATDVITGDAKYTWKVKAINTDNNTETIYSSRNFYIDTVAPNLPANASPANNLIVTLGSQVNFSWTYPSDAGVTHAPLTYTVEISNDSMFASLLQSSNTSNLSFSQSFNAAGDYFWRVKAADSAGNQGTVGNVYKFTVQ